MLNDREIAQDFLQNIFLKVIDKAEQFEISKKFSGWIFTIAYNMCKNEYRRKENVRKFQEELNNERHSHIGKTNEEKYYENRFRKVLEQELERIDPAKRTIFLLRFRTGLSIKEISEILEIPVGTVKSRLFYLLKNLRERMKEYKNRKIRIDCL